jgi:hypothetical protein
MNATHTQPTQAEKILADLQSGRRLTALDALRDFGCMRLGARILEIKAQGITIEDEWVRTETGKHVKRYFIPTQPHHTLP